MQNIDNINEFVNETNRKLEKIELTYFKIGIQQKQHISVLSKFIKTENLYADQKNFKYILKETDSFEIVLNQLPSADQIREMQELTQYSVEFNFDRKQQKLGVENVDLNLLQELQIPEDLRPGPSSFENIGNILHFNLKDKHLPYKQIIGACIYLQNKGCKTILNKTSPIEGEFRATNQEQIFGEENFISELIENNLKFILDVSEVQWCSRLQSERDNMLVNVKDTHANSLFVDLTGGVGPMSIRISKFTDSICNDLNPYACIFAKINSVVNNTQKRMLVTNLDCCLFMQYFKSNEINLIKDKFHIFDEVIVQDLNQQSQNIIRSKQGKKLDIQNKYWNHETLNTFLDKIEKYDKKLYHINIPGLSQTFLKLFNPQQQRFNQKFEFTGVEKQFNDINKMKQNYNIQIFNNTQIYCQIFWTNSINISEQTLSEQLDIYLQKQKFRYQEVRNVSHLSSVQVIIIDL